jgi:hypothetical protein
MLVEVAKRNIRAKERSVLKGAFVIKVFRLVGELTAMKESLEGYCRRGNNIDFVDSLILCYGGEVCSSAKSRLKDVQRDGFSLI